ncbi:phage tail family protein [Aerococcaceae bacterium NML191219]|nr:phage tail family protein [Aerococcaceae bacterium NML191219]
MIKVTFDGVDVYQNKRIVLEEFSIGMPEPKIIKVSIPGRDGDIDMSHALTGFMNYHNREIVMQFGLIGTEAECEDRKRYLLANVMGKEVKIRFSHLQGYFLGICKSSNLSRQKRHYTLEFTFDCQPFRFDETETSYTLNLTSSEQELNCFNSGERVSPTIITTGKTILRFQSTSYSLERGTHRLSLILSKGNNVMRVSGAGTITIKFRKGVF